ncbi:MAG TPA: thiopeptide-type bacteriocin biosynthesis protein [Pseudonocardiaceae bacterium]
MPPDQLNPPTTDRTERALLKVLAGTPLAEVATAESTDPVELADAVRLYQQAGRHALQQHTTSGWWQVYIQFHDWNTAEHTAAQHLAPLLHHAENDQLLTRWWFMRKHPYWRLRLQPATDSRALREQLGAALDDLAANGRITGWHPGIYEAETAAFGGPTAMDTAHTLFCEDSAAILNLAGNGADDVLGRRELSMLLCGILLRAAKLEWYEQGDIWHRIAHERRLPDDLPAAKLATLSHDLQPLLLANTTPDGPLFHTDGPLTRFARWANAFHQAGHDLGTANRAGRLDRGLRHILSYHVIFHWNRLGLPAHTQAILAHAAHAAILN